MASKKFGKSSSTLISFVDNEKPTLARNSSDVINLTKNKNIEKITPRKSGVA